MLSNALKKSLSSVYEPTSYKKLYRLLVTLFNKDVDADINHKFEIELEAYLDRAGVVTKIL